MTTRVFRLAGSAHGALRFADASMFERSEDQPALEPAAANVSRDKSSDSRPATWTELTAASMGLPRCKCGASGTLMKTQRGANMGREYHKCSQCNSWLGWAGESAPKRAFVEDGQPEAKRSRTFKTETLYLQSQSAWTDVGPCQDIVMRAGVSNGYSVTRESAYAVVFRYEHLRFSKKNVGLRHEFTAHEDFTVYIVKPAITDVLTNAANHDAAWVMLHGADVGDGGWMREGRANYIAFAGRPDSDVLLVDRAWLQTWVESRLKPDEGKFPARQMFHTYSFDKGTDESFTLIPLPEMYQEAERTESALAPTTRPLLIRLQQAAAAAAAVVRATAH